MPPKRIMRACDWCFLGGVVKPADYIVRDQGQERGLCEQHAADRARALVASQEAMHQ